MREEGTGIGRRRSLGAGVEGEEEEKSALAACRNNLLSV